MEVHVIVSVLVDDVDSVPVNRADAVQAIEGALADAELHIVSVGLPEDYGYEMGN